MEELFKIIPAIVAGKYDKYSYGLPSIENPLNHFKEKYKDVRKGFSISDIGFEDYFTVHMLFCYEHKIVNPTKYDFRQAIRRLFLDSIFNFGKIQVLYKKYPEKFIKFLNDADNIFTTNYDWNLEKATSKSIKYLHGAFHILDENYDRSSLKSKLHPNNFDFTITNGQEHLFSTALMDNGGKDFSLNLGNQANSAMEKMAQAYLHNDDLKAQVDTWQFSDNELVKNLFSSTLLKSADANLKFQEYDAFTSFKDIKDELVIIGLSPDNDNHLFDSIENNIDVKSVIYYYWDITDVTKVEAILPTKNIKFIAVSDFWNIYGK